MALPNAESVNYWKTGTGSPDQWMDKAKREVEGAGGDVLAEGFGREESTGRAAYMLAFRFADESFRLVWPVLPSSDDKAARRQAATMLYHDVKSRCVTAKVFGFRSAFFSYLQLADGRMVAELAAEEVVHAIPSMLQRPLLTDDMERDP